MNEFIKFNLLEGIFWINLGMTSLVLYEILNKRYRTISLVSALALFLFGISDFIEIKKGSFLEPQLWWLYIWKIINVGIFLFIIVWYLKLRVSKE